MDPMQVALIQLESSDAESAGDRLKRGSDLVSSAATDGAQLVVLPELWAVGYFHFDRYEESAEQIDGPFVIHMSALAQHHGIYLAAGSFVERASSGALHNTAVTFSPDGSLLHTYRKIHVFGFESLEANLLTAGQDASVSQTPFGGLAVTTCYDLRFPELFRELLDVGSELVIVPAAWPAERKEHWRLLTSTRAVENQTFVLACNAAGLSGGVELAGSSRIIDPWGQIVAEAGRGEETLTATISPGLVAKTRKTFPVLADRGTQKKA